MVSPATVSSSLAVSARTSARDVRVEPSEPSLEDVFLAVVGRGAPEAGHA